MGQNVRDYFRVLRLVARHDRRALRQEAERNPAGLARWAHASESWTYGEISAARQSAEMELQNTPNDFEMLRVCLDYYIRARDSEQIYAYSKRLLAAKNPAVWLRRLSAVESVLLWPISLLGYNGAYRVKVGADNCDRWVAWARAYVTKHFKQFASSQTPGEVPIERDAIAVTARTLSQHAWMVVSIDVSIDGEHILTTGAIKADSGSSKQGFTYGGRSHEAVLIWGKRSPRSVPYTLEIDGCAAEISRARISNWWTQYWVFAATFTVAALWFLLIVVA